MKVKELAGELGVTSHTIVSRCRATGLPVQNSLTRLPPELERTVRAWFAAPPEAPDAAKRNPTSA